ncbi:uncharacterized protein LOC120846941 [Ixodes scapularis]|uniref:uncharacterized protein LOC120846941 n=1 Tax=Ixodes scapularis TaxID=6945 RepID=UPI001C388B9E|nr:uncharacterized protein LOC120846941 [Ixodes scapularis]
MAPLGKLVEYDAKQQNFDSYLERFEHSVSANDIKPEKKLAVFLTVIGPRAYEVLKSLVVPAVPGDKSFKEVKVLLKNHYSPKSSVIAERCKFNRRVQEEQESVEDFIVALKHLARKCDFGQFLQDALRDRLVAGIRREETQRGLFAEESLTFEKACKIALDQEQAARQTALLHAGSKDASLNEIRANQKDNVNKRDVRKHKQSKKSCERCGRAHAASKCWYKNATCHKCGKLGHLQKVCSNEKKGPKNANAVDCSEDDSELDVYHCLNTVVRFTHADHIRDRLASPTSLAAPPTPEEPTLPDVPVPRETQPMVPQVASAAMPADSQAGSQQATRTRQQPLPPPSSTSAPVTTPEPCTEAPTSRRSTRVRRPPDRYKPEDFRS